MIDITLAGGACPARPMTYALPRAMRYPHSDDDVPLADCDLAVVAYRGDVRQLVGYFVRTAHFAKVPNLVAHFDEANPTVCRGLCLFMPVSEGIMVSNVEPCIPRPGSSMILVTADRTRAVAMRADGKLMECEVPRPACLKKGIARGWAELIRRMNASVTADGAFRHASYELHLLPVGAAAFV